MTNALKTGWKRMHQKTANKLIGPESHWPLLLFSMGAVVLVAEHDLVVGDALEPMVRDGHAVRVSAEVINHLLRPAKGRFAVDDPLASCQLSEQLWKVVRQRLEDAEELELACLESHTQRLEQQAAE